MGTAKAILKQYWGYGEFRPGQEDIVNHILAGRDTIALLPTGGGKSICFQVPGMMHGGLTLVVSPLISLIKDQVDGLVKRDIPAVALHSGLSYGEMRLRMDNALKGAYRFMYISPERLATENFREYLPNLNIRLLVVDEAHCVSQWGYEFRPAYLRIAECRQLLPGIPVAAFTASAPPYVVQDIADKLALSEPAITTGDFRRGNLHFYVNQTEDKTGTVVRILSRTAGSSLVFVRNRRETEEFSRLLAGQGISCDYYHAGLAPAERAARQDAWIRGRTRVMVCTNAFGMGIDKPDVRFVFHLSPPPSAEDYYQESGRAGRDGKDSWCMLLYRNFDFEQLRLQVEVRYPGRDMLARVYTAVMNHLGIPDGGGTLATYELDTSAISGRYKIPHADLVHALQAMEILNFWALSEGVLAPSRVHFTMDYASVYDFKLRHPAAEPLLDVIMRSLGGVFDDYVRISEKSLARRLRMEEREVVSMLQKLNNDGVLDYEPASDKPRIMLLEPRSPYPVFNVKHLEPLKKSRLQAIDTMQQYVYSAGCRAAWWIGYFTGKDAEDCGKCDHCARQKKQMPRGFEHWEKWIREKLQKVPVSQHELMESFPGENAAEARNVLRWLQDNGRIVKTEEGLLKWSGT